MDAAAKMAPVTTATQGMERQHMAFEGVRWFGEKPEWMAEKLKNLSPDHVLACSREGTH